MISSVSVNSGQVRNGDIRRSSALSRPPCDDTPSTSVWPSPRQTPWPPCPYPSGRAPPDATLKPVDAPRRGPATRISRKKNSMLLKCYTPFDQSSVAWNCFSWNPVANTAPSTGTWKINSVPTSNRQTSALLTYDKPVCWKKGSWAQTLWSAKLRALISRHLGFLNAQTFSRRFHYFCFWCRFHQRYPQILLNFRIYHQTYMMHKSIKTK